MANLTGSLTSSTTRRLVLATLFAGLGVLLSSFAIPVGGARVFPFQHTINAVAGILLGPWWAAGSALVTATLRVSLGTGSLFAFPGSPFGAIAVGLVYRFLRRDEAALLEPVGTVLVGAPALQHPRRGDRVSGDHSPQKDGSNPVEKYLTFTA